MLPILILDFLLLHSVLFRRLCRERDIPYLFQALYAIITQVCMTVLVTHTWSPTNINQLSVSEEVCAPCFLEEGSDFFSHSFKPTSKISHTD